MKGYCPIQLAEEETRDAIKLMKKVKKFVRKHVSPTTTVSELDSIIDAVFWEIDTTWRKL